MWMMLPVLAIPGLFIVAILLAYLNDYRINRMRDGPQAGRTKAYLYISGLILVFLLLCLIVFLWMLR
jgi:hypothetical protein